MRTRNIPEYDNDPTPSREVVEAYREAIEDDGDSDLLLQLVHYRGTQEEYDLSLEYAASEDPLDRVTAANILCQLGLFEPTFLEESATVLIRLLKDADPRVLASAAIAIGHREVPTAIPFLIPLAGHEDPGVRLGVAFGLAAHENDSSIQALIYLSKDTDDDVRERAVFSLGHEISANTPGICDALFANLDDLNPGVRGEALIGLAFRKDVRLADAILVELGKEDISDSALEAIGSTQDPRWLPYLEKLLQVLPPRGGKARQRSTLKRIITFCQS